MESLLLWDKCYDCKKFENEADFGVSESTPFCEMSQLRGLEDHLWQQIGLQNTNFVEDIEYLLSIQFHKI